MTFSPEVLSNIDRIFKTASNEGRNLLYEFEVYQILHEIGLEVPKFVFVRDPAEVNEKMSRIFGRELMAKIVSPQIAHKQVVGGVKKIGNNDPLYIQFVLSRMTEEVFRHFPQENLPEIKGFLLVEYVPHTQALGYEVLIGFKEDPAFGPVLTLSKGGDDAEFFARYFDPANLFLTPLDNETALTMLQSLHIKFKFQQIGHPEYLEYMAKAASLLSWLSYHYSFIAGNRPAFVIQAMDINPFVITQDSRLVAIDGFAQFTPASQSTGVVLPVNLGGMESFFRPQGVAVIGVSADPGKYSLGREIAHSLHDMERDDLFFINAKGGTINFEGKEYQLYPKLQNLPTRVDLVVYAAPAQFTVDFIKDLESYHPKAVILISGIPADVKYPDFVAEIMKALPGGVRIIGPNCMGVYFAPDNGQAGLNTLFIEEKRLEIKYSGSSNTALLTQSGALAVTAIDKLQNARIFKAIVSFGNKVDVKITDLLAYFANERVIDLIALYIEGLDPGEGRQFFQLAGEITKPLVVYKAGRTEAGARAAASHTASMSGSYDVFKAACRQVGVILAENIEDYYNYIKIFSLLARKIPRGNRVAGVVNAGFESTMGADELNNLIQARLGPETLTKLNRINKFGLVDTSTPFLDITPMADDQMYVDFVEAILQDDQVDCVFVAIVPHAVSLKTTPETCYEPDSLAKLLVAASKKYQKPMVVSVNADRYYQDFVSILEENGLPVYTDIRSAIKSLDIFVSYHRSF
jgi:3-hydroxypropionyl-CoA synthetase (ADP-forming)